MCKSFNICRHYSVFVLMRVLHCDADDCIDACFQGWKVFSRICRFREFDRGCDVNAPDMNHAPTELSPSGSTVLPDRSHSGFGETMIWLIF